LSQAHFHSALHSILWRQENGRFLVANPNPSDTPTGDDEHVCLTPQVVIIDCLEFSRALRVIDKANEVGYIALECERQGAARLGAAILKSYRPYSGGHFSGSLLHFHQSCRASKRAVMAARHLREPKHRLSPHWQRTASSSLSLAGEHVYACRVGWSGRAATAVMGQGPIADLYHARQ
jgi:hypothetical protein